MSNPSRWRLSAESITAIAAVLTALVALGVGVWQTAETRRHNRLSVRPHLTFNNLIRVNADRFGNPTTEASLGTTLTVTNDGLGIAVVMESDLRVTARDGRVATSTEWESLIPGLQEYGVQARSRRPLSPGTRIEPGEQVTILELEATTMSTPDSMSMLMERVRIEVDYESLYEEPFSATYPRTE